MMWMEDTQFDRILAKLTSKVVSDTGIYVADHAVDAYFNCAMHEQNALVVEILSVNFYATLME